MHLAARVNQYVSDEAPWAVLKVDRERAGTILYVALRCIDNLKIALHAVPAVLVAAAARAARPRRAARRPARDPRGRRGRRRRPTRCSRATTHRGSAAGSRRDSRAGQALREPAAALREARPGGGRRRRARADGGAGRRRRDRHARAPRRVRRAGRGRSSTRARAAGVTRIVTIGTGHRLVPRGARRSPSCTTGVFAALGIDPHQAATRRGRPRRRAARPARRIRSRSRSGRRGSTASTPSRRSTSSSALFDAPARARGGARASGRDPQPRGGRGDGRRARARSPGTVILHCFSSPGLLETAVERGYYVSFAGNVTYPKAAELRLLRPARPARPPPRRDRQPVPRAAARARPAERAGERRAHARRARRGARRGARDARRGDRRERDAGVRPPVSAHAPKKALGQHFLVDGTSST